VIPRSKHSFIPEIVAATINLTLFQRTVFADTGYEKKAVNTDTPQEVGSGAMR
jgi:hypothetical protein